jgi:hypothetical protein
MSANWCCHGRCLLQEQEPTILLGVSGGVLGRLASGSEVRCLFALGSPPSPALGPALPADVALTSRPAQEHHATHEPA